MLRGVYSSRVSRKELFSPGKTTEIWTWALLAKSLTVKHKYDLVPGEWIQRSEHQHSAHAVAIGRCITKHKTLSFLQVLLWVFHPLPLVLNLHPPLSLTSLGPRCVGRPGCKGYSLRFARAQMNRIPGSVACHSEEQ